MYYTYFKTKCINCLYRGFKIKNGQYNYIIMYKKSNELSYMSVICKQVYQLN